MNKKIIIAIDGFSACGKSTIAKLVAYKLQYAYIDTGAMYRAVTLYFIQNHVKMTNPKDVDEALQKITVDFKYNTKRGKSETYLNGLNVEDEIRKMYVTEKVSPVSALKPVREALVKSQQKMGKKGGVILDGRDIGTTVFPDAELKIFMIADDVIRAKRRQQELFENGEALGLEKVMNNLKERDRIDTTREESPLKQAEDAIVLDNSEISIDEAVNFIIHQYNEVVEHIS